MPGAPSPPGITRANDEDSTRRAPAHGRAQGGCAVLSPPPIRLLAGRRAGWPGDKEHEARPGANREAAGPGFRVLVCHVGADIAPTGRVAQGPDTAAVQSSCRCPACSRRQATCAAPVTTIWMCPDGCGLTCGWLEAGDPRD